MKRYISARRSATVLGVDEKTVVTWRKSKAFPLKALKKGLKKNRWMIDVADMAHWIYLENYWGKWTHAEIRQAIITKLG